MNREVRIKMFQEVDIYPVTCEKLSAGRSDIEVLEAVIRGGAGIVQLREKEYADRDLYDLAVEFRSMTAEAGGSSHHQRPAGHCPGRGRRRGTPGAG